MVRESWRAGVIGALLAITAGCAHVPQRRSPTIEDYSDGTSRVVAAFTRALQMRDREMLETLCGDGYTLVPATEPSSPQFLSPAALTVDRFVPRGAAGASGAATPSDRTDPAADASSTDVPAPSGAMARAEALTYLLERREKFIGIARNDARIVGMRGRGNERTLAVHTTVHGLARGAIRMQEESWWRWDLVRGQGQNREWVLQKAVEERRTFVSTPQPIFTQVYPDEDLPPWQPGTKRPQQPRNAATPGEYDSGGIAFLPDCIQGAACILAAGGDGIAALSKGDPEGDDPYSDHAKLLGLEGSLGEAKSLLTADFNNDGIPDLFLSYHGAPCRLYQGGRSLDDFGGARRTEHLSFRDITAASGFEGMIGPYRTAIALDADRDGRLDLYVVQYGDAATHGPSDSGRNGLPNRFFRNVTEIGGPIRFVDESRSSGSDDSGWGLSAGAADFDGDGRADIYVTNDFGADVLYRNVTEPGGPVRFLDVTARTGIQARSLGTGVAWGDYDLDGDMDLYVASDWLEEQWIFGDPRFPGSTAKKRFLRKVPGNALYRNDTSASGRFVPVSAPAGVLDGGWSWGTVWSDVDGDGRQDLVVVGGMLAGEGGPGREIAFWNEMSSGWKDFTSGRLTIDLGKDGVTGPQAKKIYLNLGDGTFADVAFSAGFDTTNDLRGVAAADVNGDGAPDLIAGGFLVPPEIFMNLNSGLPPRVMVKLEGTASNWDAVGAIVHVTSSGMTQTRQVSAGGSFLSDGSRALDFGIGPSREIDEIRVDWPSGAKSVLERPKLQEAPILITEPPKDGLPPPQ